MNYKIIVASCIFLMSMLVLFYSYKQGTNVLSNEYIYKTGSSEEIQAFNDFQKSFKKLTENTDIYALQEVTDLCSAFMSSSQSIPFWDKAFTEYRNYYFKVLKNTNLNLYGIECNYNSTCGSSDGYKLDRTNYKIHKFITNKGFNLIWNNGKFSITESPEFLMISFAKSLNPMWIEFFKYRIDEQKKGYIENGKLIIEPDGLMGRIIFWEKFLHTYPEFPEQKEIHIKISQYINAYLFGTSNSPVFDELTNKINPESVISYENFILNHKNSKYFPYVSEYYKLLKKNNFIYDTNIYKSIKDLLEKNNISKPVTDIDNNYVHDNGYVIKFM